MEDSKATASLLMPSETSVSVRLSLAMDEIILSNNTWLYVALKSFFFLQFYLNLI